MGWPHPAKIPSYPQARARPHATMSSAYRPRHGHPRRLAPPQEKLFGHTAHLVRRAIDLIERCDCRSGCPACVGPDAPDIETDVKAQTLRLLRAIG